MNNIKKSKKEDSLSSNIDSYFEENPSIEESLIWNDSDAPESLKEDWTWPEDNSVKNEK